LGHIPKTWSHKIEKKNNEVTNFKTLLSERGFLFVELFMNTLKMKYIISESKIPKVAMIYLDDELGNLNKWVEKVLNTTYMNFSDGDYTILKVVSSEGEGNYDVYIRKDFFNSFQKMFKLWDARAYEILDEWVEKKFGVKVDVVYTF